MGAAQVLPADDRTWLDQHGSLHLRDSTIDLSPASECEAVPAWALASKMYRALLFARCQLQPA